MQTEVGQSLVSQKQLYEDLSALILAFKRLASLAEAVAVLIEKNQDHTRPLLKIKYLLQTLGPLIEKYEKVSSQNYIQGQQKSSNSSTFYRFICRLLEVIAFLNGKYQNRTNQHHFSILNNCLRQIEASIKRYKESKELFRLIKIIQMSFVKFCINCRAPESVLYDNAQKKCKETFNQMRQRVTKDKKDGSRDQRSSKFNHLFTEMDESSSEESDSKSEKGFKKNISNRKNYFFRTEYSKQLTKLQKRFNTLKHLDLDYSYFKSDYFLAKGNQPLFFGQYLEKNILNRRIITNYYDDFCLFLKKKAQKQGRKDKFKLQSYMKKFQPSNVSFDLLQSQNCIQNEIDEQGQIMTTKVIKVGIKNKNLRDEHGAKSLDYQSGGKKELKMKNVQITLLGTSKEENKYKLNSGFNKNKSRLQPICINQSYYNDLQAQTNNSLQFLHRKLKVEGEMKKCNKTLNEKQIKTEYTLKQMHSFSQIAKKGDLVSYILKSKSSFKGKYLEVNCKNEKKDQARRLFSKEGYTMQKITMKNVGNLGKRGSQGKLIIKNEQ